MKFEEVLPALRAGKKITNSFIKNSGYQYIHYLDEIIFNDKGGSYHLTDKDIMERDDWEIVEEKKKVKVRDLTKEQLEKYCRDFTLARRSCSKCPFNVVSCEYWCDKGWINHKDLYNDKFLDQEIEIDEECKKMELNDTIKLMESDNYKDRFRAEYHQLEIRCDKLGEMLKKYEKNELDFKPKCSYSLLLNQYKVMGDYLALLRLRAGIEEIRLEE